MNRKDYLKTLFGTTIGAVGALSVFSNSFAISSKGKFVYNDGSDQIIIDANDIKANETNIRNLQTNLGDNDSGIVKRLVDAEKTIAALVSYLENTHMLATDGESSGTTLDAYNITFDASLTNGQKWSSTKV